MRVKSPVIGRFVIAALVVTMAACQPVSPPPAGGPRIDLRVLVVDDGGPTVAALTTELSHDLILPTAFRRPSFSVAESELPGDIEPPLRALLELPQPSQARRLQRAAREQRGQSARQEAGRAE